MATIRVEVHDSSILRARALTDVARGDVFLYGGELVKRFALNDHEVWAPLSGPKAMVVHDFGPRIRTDTIAIVETANLHVSMQAHSPMLERSGVTNPFGYALILSYGIAFGASGVDDDQMHEPGRMSLDLLGQESGFHSSSYALAVAEWSIVWRDTFGNVALTLERTVE